MDLRAVITPEQFPFIEEPLRITNRRKISIRAGYITFYVTPKMVVAVKKSMENTSKMWEEKTWETIVYEIKTKIDVL